MTSFFSGPFEFFIKTPVGGSLAPSTGHPPADEGERTSPAPSSSALRPVRPSPGG